MQCSADGRLRADGRLLAQVRPLAEARRWLLREAKTRRGRPEALLGRDGPAVVLSGSAATWSASWAWWSGPPGCTPAAAVVVVGDSDHAVVAGLAWDLGARLVLIPALERRRGCRRRSQACCDPRRRAVLLLPRVDEQALHRLRRLRAHLPDALPGAAPRGPVAAAAGRLRRLRPVRRRLPATTPSRSRFVFRTSRDRKGAVCNAPLPYGRGSFGARLKLKSLPAGG